MTASAGDALSQVLIAAILERHFRADLSPQIYPPAPNEMDGAQVCRPGHLFLRRMHGRYELSAGTAGFPEPFHQPHYLLKPRRSRRRLRSSVFPSNI